MSHGFLSSLTGLVLFFFTLPTDKSVGYFLSPCRAADVAQGVAEAPKFLDDVEHFRLFYLNQFADQRNQDCNTSETSHDKTQWLFSGAPKKHGTAKLVKSFPIH